jgi:hypothetical protein
MPWTTGCCARTPIPTLAAGGVDRTFHARLVDAFKHRRDYAGAKLFVERLPAFMPLDGAGTPVPVNPVERGLADAWARTAPGLPPGLRHRLRAAAYDFAEANLWELANTVHHRVPDPVDYIGMRRRTAGTPLSTVLPLQAVGQDLPGELLEHRTMQGLITAFADNVDLRNDLFSYRKEIELEGEVNNAVLVVRHFLECDPQAAFDVVGDLMNASMREFQRIVEHELPALFDEFGLDEADRARVLGYAGRLQDWLGATSPGIAGPVATRSARPPLSVGRTRALSAPPRAWAPPPPTWRRRSRAARCRGTALWRVHARAGRQAALRTGPP